MIAVCVPYSNLCLDGGVLTVTHTSTLQCSADDYDMSLCFSTSLLNIKILGPFIRGKIRRELSV